MAWRNGLDLVCLFPDFVFSPLQSKLCSCNCMVYVRSFSFSSPETQHLALPTILYSSFTNCILVWKSRQVCLSKSTVLVSIRPQCEQTGSLLFVGFFLSWKYEWFDTTGHTIYFPVYLSSDYRELFRASQSQKHCIYKAMLSQHVQSSSLYPVFGTLWF